jgi:hypothetical protein
MSGTLIKGRGNAPIPQMGTKKACAKNCVWTLIEFSNHSCFELSTMQSPYLPLPQTKIPLHTQRIYRLNLSLLFFYSGEVFIKNSSMCKREGPGHNNNNNNNKTIQRKNSTWMW